MWPEGKLVPRQVWHVRVSVPPSVLLKPMIPVGRGRRVERAGLVTAQAQEPAGSDGLFVGTASATADPVIEGGAGFAAVFAAALGACDHVVTDLSAPEKRGDAGVLLGELAL
jgi:hypothetical protein